MSDSVPADSTDQPLFRRRTTQVVAVLGTSLLTAYICSWGPIPAILALSVAKHVLVAVLMMGLQPPRAAS